MLLSFGILPPSQHTHITHTPFPPSPLLPLLHIRISTAKSLSFRWLITAWLASPYWEWKHSWSGVMEKAKTDKGSSEFCSYPPLTGCAVLAFSASLSPCCGWSLSYVQCYSKGACLHNSSEGESSPCPSPSQSLSTCTCTHPVWFSVCSESKSVTSKTSLLNKSVLKALPVCFGNKIFGNRNSATGLAALKTHSPFSNWACLARFGWGKGDGSTRSESLCMSNPAGKEGYKELSHSPLFYSWRTIIFYAFVSCCTREQWRSWLSPDPEQVESYSLSACSPWSSLILGWSLQQPHVWACLHFLQKPRQKKSFWVGKGSLPKFCFFPAQSKNLDVWTDRMLTGKKKKKSTKLVLFQKAWV